MREKNIGAGDFLGVSRGSGEEWSAALDSPVSNGVALSLVAAAGLLQINGADHHYQNQLENHQYGPGNSPGTLSDVGQLSLLGGALAAPWIFAPHPKLGVPKQDYFATASYAFLASFGLNQAVKSAVSRKRPDGSDKNSFYSGHATNSFTGATLLYRMYGWNVGVPAYTVASLVALYRVEDAQHNPSDVLVGAAVGIWLTNLIYEKNHGDEGLFTKAYGPSVSPLVLPHGVGVTMSWSW